MDNPLVRLRRFIAAHYDVEEFRTLCVDLGVSYDELRGEGLSARVRELVLYLGRRERFEPLLQRLSRERPDSFDLDTGAAALKALYAALPTFQADDLKAEIVQLRQALSSLAQSGVPTTEGQGRLAALKAQLVALGPVAQDHGAAVGRDVGRDVVTGLKVTGVDQGAQTVHGAQTNVLHAAGPVLSGTFNVYQRSLGAPELSEAQFGRVLDDYLTWVLDEYGRARLHGLQALQGSGPYRKPLSEVYTSLRVSRRPAVESGGLLRRVFRSAPDEEAAPFERAEPLDMADLLTLGPRAAIVGGAGCGKTTYLAFVAAGLAAALGGRELDARLKPQRPGELLPVPLLAPLRFWNVYRQDVAQRPGVRFDRPDAGSLKDFLLWYLRHSYKNFEAAGDFFERLLRGGGGLIMFDGLDEVVSREERLVVRDAISRLFDRSPYRDNLCLVTAREAGYRDAPFGSDFVRCDVQPMDESQVAALVDAWCRDIPELEVARERIVRIIAELNEERQEPLVGTPLMVTMIVSVYYSKKELPRERAKLYDAVTDVILQSQYSEADEVGARKLVVTWGEELPPGKQREWLSLLAFLMHQAGDEGAVADEERVRELLAPPLQDRGELARLDAFIAQAEARGGLFELRGERFQFTHLTFQEYLAGQHLSSQWREEREHLPAWVVQGWWREALLLTVGSLDHPRPFREREDLLAYLLALEAPAEAQVAAAELAASGLLGLGQAEDVLCDRARARLVSLLTDPALEGVSGPTRARAGSALAGLGDPRPGVGLNPETGLPDIVWCPVPAGPFMMGEKGERHSVKLSSYLISRYPVTNAQFAAFVKDGGYTKKWRRCWTEAGWHWKGNQTKLATFGGVFDLPNHPVVGVTWYEAVAFCRWLGEKWAVATTVPEAEQSGQWAVLVGGEIKGLQALENAQFELLGRAIRQSSSVLRLPTEAEWEKAARGTDERAYPWGDKFDAAKCNMDDTGIGATSAVGIFSSGASPYGLLDMAGNVWEWTSSLYKGFPYRASDGREDVSASGNRVLRGGAWCDPSVYARSAYRAGPPPDRRYVYWGFRCVVAPTSSSL